MLELRRADDRRRHARLVQEPCQPDLGGRHAALGRYLLNPIHDVEVLGAAVPLVLERIGFRAPGSALSFTRARAGEEAAGERAPRDDPDALVDALRDHLALLLAVDEVVVVLHRDELAPAVALGDALRLRELPRVHAARADVARLARAHDVV